MGLGNYFIQDSDKDNFFRIVFFWKIKPTTWICSYTVLRYNHYFIILTICLMSALYNQMVVSSYSFPSPQKLINKISASPLCNYDCVFDNYFLIYKKKVFIFFLLKKSSVFHCVSKSTASSIILKKKLDCQAGNNL